MSGRRGNLMFYEITSLDVRNDIRITNYFLSFLISTITLNGQNRSMLELSFLNPVFYLIF